MPKTDIKHKPIKPKPAPAQDDNPDDSVNEELSLAAEAYAIGGRPKTVLHNAYRGRK